MAIEMKSVFKNEIDEYLKGKQKPTIKLLMNI
jgi:hypothetical protein